MQIMANTAMIAEEDIASCLQLLSPWQNIEGLSHRLSNGRHLLLALAEAVGLVLPASATNWPNVLERLGIFLPSTHIAPTLIANPVLYFHQQLMARSDYAQLVPWVHDGLIEKISDIRASKVNKQPERVAKFTANALVVLGRLADGVFSGVGDQFDRVNDIATKQLQSHALKGDYVWATFHVYQRLWQSLTRCKANKQFFTRTASLIHKLPQPDPSLDPLKINDQDDASLAELDVQWQACVRADTEMYGLNLQPDIDKPDADVLQHKVTSHRIVLDLNESPYQPSVFSLASLAIIASLVEQRAQELSVSQGLALRIFICGLFTLGRRPDWLGRVLIHNNKDAAVYPHANLANGILRYRPRMFVGYPTWLEEQFNDQHIIEHDLRYESLSLVIAIPLAPNLLDLLKQLHCTSNGQYLFEILPEEFIKREFKLLSQRLRSQIPHAHALTPSRLALSWSAHLAGAGLDPLYRYYIQERALAHLHMPLRYTHISPVAFSKSYSSATQRFSSELSTANRAIAESRHLPPATWLYSREEWPSLDPNQAGWGSWHCARRAG